MISKLNRLQVTIIRIMEVNLMNNETPIPLPKEKNVF